MIASVQTNEGAVRSSDDVSAQADLDLAESVREEAKRVVMSPVKELSRPEIERHLKQAAAPNHMTLIALADQVYAKLKQDYPDRSEHLAWFKSRFSPAG